MTDAIQQDLQDVYGRPSSSRDYAWSGLASFRDIEAAVFEGEAWNPRAEYILASERVHSSPNAGEPLDVGDNPPVFLVGPIDSGLTGPADLTSLSILAATEALMLNASRITGDAEKLEELAAKRQMIGVVCWVVDPEIFCHECGGYRPGALPPEGIPIDERPEPCSCR